MLRSIIDRNQSQFAAMIGTTRDAVASWEGGRNRISRKFALRIHVATGAMPRDLVRGSGAPRFELGERPYSLADFDQWRKRANEPAGDIAARYAKAGASSLEVLLLAAAKPGGGKVKDRLPAVCASFMEWCEQTRNDFKLSKQIEEVLAQRKFKDRLTLSWGDWRREAARGKDGLYAILQVQG